MPSCSNKSSCSITVAMIKLQAGEERAEVPCETADLCWNSRSHSEFQRTRSTTKPKPMRNSPRAVVYALGLGFVCGYGYGYGSGFGCDNCSLAFS